MRRHGDVRHALGVVTGRGGALLAAGQPLEPTTEALHVEVHDRGGVERQHLRHDQPAPARAATPAPPAPLLSLEPDLADWEIPESMTPAAGPAVPLPKPPPLTLPRMAAVRLPTDPVIPRPASMTPVPTPPLPGSPRVGGILPSAPVPRERTLPPRPAGRVDPQKKE